MLQKFVDGMVAVRLKTQEEWYSFMETIEYTTDLSFENHLPTQFNGWVAEKEDTVVTIGSRLLYEYVVHDLVVVPISKMKFEKPFAEIVTFQEFMEEERIDEECSTQTIIRRIL